MIGGARGGKSVKAACAKVRHGVLCMRNKPVVGGRRFGELIGSHFELRRKRHQSSLTGRLHLRSLSTAGLLCSPSHIAGTFRAVGPQGVTQLVIIRQKP